MRRTLSAFMPICMLYCDYNYYLLVCPNILDSNGKNRAFYVPPNRRGGDAYCFGADPVGVGVRVASFPHSILLMDFDQTCIDTFLGGSK